MTLPKLSNALCTCFFSSLILLGNPAVIASSTTSQPQEETTHRIISTDASSTDIIIALGNGADLVGVDVTSQLPENVKAAKVGYHRTLSAEGLLSLNPNLIIGSEHMGPPETINAVKNAQLTVLQLPTARDDKTLKNNITLISKTLNKPQHAQALIEHINTQMNQLKQRQLSTITSVAFLLQMDGRGLQLAGASTAGNDIIHLLGGNNLASYHGYQAVSAESLLELQPDVIIIASKNSTQPAEDTLLKNNPLLAHTPAGQQNNIVAIDAASLVAGISIKSLDALAVIAKTLQPPVAKP